MRIKIIEDIKPFFRIEELVCPHVFKKFGAGSWMFLDTNYLHALLVIRRDVLQVPLISNTYHATGDFTQRGLRCNICQLVRDKTLAGQVYITAHLHGKAGDFVSGEMTAGEMRKKIKEKQHLLPCNIRIEKDVTWLHFDVYDTGQKIYEFNG
jgi:hypothetical protein